MAGDEEIKKGRLEGRVGGRGGWAGGTEAERLRCTHCFSLTQLFSLFLLQACFFSLLLPQQWPSLVLISLAMQSVTWFCLAGQGGVHRWR